MQSAMKIAKGTYIHLQYYTVQWILNFVLSRANNNECGYKGHESIRWDGRKRLEPGSMAEVVDYMYENNGMCAWGKFLTLWKKYFPERPLNI